MEHPRTPLPPSARVLFLESILLPSRSHVHHFPRQRRSPRASDELYHKKAPRIRVLIDDAPTTHYCGAEISFFPSVQDLECECDPRLVTE
jgi:hypothetical protein